MASASRMSVKMNPLTLLTTNASISSGQLFGADIRITVPTQGGVPNCQFIIDLLSSDDDNKTKPGIEINSFVMRRGRVRYDVLDKAHNDSVFDANHIDVRNISGHLVFRQDTKGNAEVKLKKLSFTEHSGLDMKRLAFRLKSDNKGITVNDLAIHLPNTKINIDNAAMNYKKHNGKIIDATVSYAMTTDSSTIVLADLSSFLPMFRNFNTPLVMNTKITGTSTSVRIHKFKLHSHDRRIDIETGGSLSNFDNPTWAADIHRLVVNAGTVNTLKENFGEKDNNEIEVLSRLGDIHFIGRTSGASGSMSLRGNMITDAGSATFALGMKGKTFNGSIDTKHLDLGKIAAADDLGNMAARLEFNGQLKDNTPIPDITARGTVAEISYKNHTYCDITIDGSYLDHKFDGLLSIDDPDASVELKGIASYYGTNPTANFYATVRRFKPSALGLTDRWNEAVFDMNIEADFKGRDANSTRGDLRITDFTMKSSSDTLYVDDFEVSAGMRETSRYLSVRSDFVDADIDGHYSYNTLEQTFRKILSQRLPAVIPSEDKKKDPNNQFDLNLKLKDALWLKMFLGIPVSIDEPIMLSSKVNGKDNDITFTCNIPQLTYNDQRYSNGHINILTKGDSLVANAHMTKTMGNGRPTDFSLKAAAIDGRLLSSIAWDNNNDNEFVGCINTVTDFVDNGDRKDTHITFHPSDMMIGGVKWYLRPSEVTIGDKNVSINNFTIENDSQHLIISGKATDSPNDSIVVNMHDLEVAYILNLVNFHSVEFSGRASGKAYVSQLFARPEASTTLTVDDFRFQNGRLGCLYANVLWNNEEEQIDIDAIADDDPTGCTLIKGYVSPKRNYLWLEIGAKKMRAEFLEGFCGSFMHNVTATIQGDAIVGGPLDRVNLMGDLYLTGGLGISSIGTDYHLDNVEVHCEPDVIQIRQGAMSDNTGGKGILDGTLRHRSFSKLKFDLGVEAEGLPMYNLTGDNGDTFYGTVYIDGKCRIHGVPKEVMIDVDATPVKNSFMVYDASAPDAISNRNFITWKTDRDTTEVEYEREELYNSTDIRMNMNIDATSALQLKVLMDKESGDNIVLRGEGSLRATYYNKGPFNMFGTYNVREGNYRLTIQQILEKNFRFQNGSRIVFSGDPYDASLDLNATHTVNGVSLSDLKIGKSFSNNTIRVNCIMGIKGTPEQPHVDFDIDMPTVDGEVQQMIRSMITTEEDMNRQVVYILGIGRFYVPEDANMNTETGPSQTSLAMQSLLSGTISSQINSLIGRIVNSNEWNFGANISTGDEGWNNAEYEGIVTGRMLDNRLLINGQFGYRDNANATTGFIGDFDIRYLLFPNGNLAVRLYNQTNDRYFTKSALNTQGVGLILKKDFHSLRDLFGLSNKKKRKKTEQPVRTLLNVGNVGETKIKEKTK